MFKCSQEDLLELLDKQETVISKQLKIIKTLTQDNYEKENLIHVLVSGKSE